MESKMNSIVLWISMVIRCALCFFLALPLVIVLKIADWFYAYEWGFSLFHFLINMLCKLAIWCSWVPVSYKGVQNIGKPPAIIVANHQSAFDIILVGALTGRAPQCWFAKSELGVQGMSIFLHWILKRIAIMVDLDYPAARMKTIFQAIQHANAHSPYIILFPEGGRYTDGKIHEFFGGFVVLARKMKLPVIPVYISGAHKVLVPNSVLVHINPVTVTVGQSMHIQDQEEDDIFKQRVWQWFAEQSNIQ